MKVEVPHPLSSELADVIAGRFRVLSEPMRIRLLDQLRGGSASVTELQRATGTSQQNASKHLGVLLEAGLVSRRREGNSARYEIADESVFELCELVCGRIERRLGELRSLLHDQGGSR